MNNILHKIYYKYKNLTQHCITTIFYLGFTLFHNIAILSYHRNDKCYNVFNQYEIKNLFSSIGSKYADLLFLLFGKANYILGIFPIFWVYQHLCLPKHLNVKNKLIKLILFLVIFSLSIEILISDVKFLQKIFNYLPYNNINLSQLLIHKLTCIKQNKIYFATSFYVLSYVLFCLSINLTTKKSLLVLKYIISIPQYILFQITKKLFSKYFLKKTKTFSEQTLEKKSYNLTNKADNKEDFSSIKTSLLDKETEEYIKKNKSEIEIEKNKLLKSLLNFNISGEISETLQGPVITTYKFIPSNTINFARIIGLTEEISRSSSIPSIRITKYNENSLAIEVPNQKRLNFRIRNIIESKEYKENRILPIILGKSSEGEIIIKDLHQISHLLITGIEESDKLLPINTIILSLLFRYKANQCQFIMIDYQKLSLSSYQNIPHLITPIIDNHNKFKSILTWLKKEIQKRHNLMIETNIKNIADYEKEINLINTEKNKIQIGFNEKTRLPILKEDLIKKVNQPPFIVIIVNELSDLMSNFNDEITNLIEQLSLINCGIHIVASTKKTSANNISEKIKSSFPNRISLKLTSKIDSKMILGDFGAEQLLGKGDMLYIIENIVANRAHAPFVSEDEIKRVTNYLRLQKQLKHVDIFNN